MVKVPPWFVFASLLVPALASAQTVNLRITQTSGVSPRIVGHNFHALDDLHDWSWVTHSAANGARVWLGAEFQDPLPGEAVATNSQFVSRRLALRDEINQGPLGNTGSAICSTQLGASTASAYVDWAHYAGQFEGGYAVTFEEMARHGMQAVIQHTLGETRPLIQDPSSAAHWQQRWEHWRHMFAVAYYVATRWNLSTFQIFNEPNIRIEAPDYVERLRLASDAIQHAIKLVNNHRTRCTMPPWLTARVLAPTAAGSPAIYSDADAEPWLNQPEAPLNKDFFCDPNSTTTRCWGRYVLQNRVANNFYGSSLTAADSFGTVFHGYSFHRYNSVEAGEQNMTDIWTYLRNFPGSPPPLPIYVTEHNRFQGSMWSASDTPDTPRRFIEFARMLMRDARALTVPTSPLADGGKNLFIFKLQQGSEAKTGLHHTATTGGRIGGATNMAEVLRLYAHGFKDGLVLWNVTSSDSAVEALAASDNRRDLGFQTMVVNTSSSVRTVDLALPSGIDGYARVDTVTPDRRGNAFIVARQNNHIVFPLPGQSVALVSAPQTARRLVGLPASADATVKGGTNRFTNYGTSGNLYAASHTSSSGARNVSFIRFSVPASVSFGNIKFATLKVYAQAKNTAGTVGTSAIAHVYALDNDDWVETQIAGRNAPNLAIVDGPMTEIAHNFVTEVGVSAHFVGHLTGLATAESIGVDVTDFVKEHGDRELTFMIVRDVRFDPVPAVNGLSDTDESTRSLWMASRESSVSANRPQLQLTLSE